jgi:hypothetical protein
MPPADLEAWLGAPQQPPIPVPRHRTDALQQHHDPDPGLLSWDFTKPSPHQDLAGGSWTMTTLRRGRWKRRAHSRLVHQPVTHLGRIKNRTPNPDLRIFDPAIDGQLKVEVAGRALVRIGRGPGGDSNP